MWGGKKTPAIAVSTLRSASVCLSVCLSVRHVEVPCFADGSVDSCARSQTRCLNCHFFPTSASHHRSEEKHLQLAARQGNMSRNPMTNFDFEVDSDGRVLAERAARRSRDLTSCGWTFAEKKNQTYPYLQVYRAHRKKRKKKETRFLLRTKLVGTEFIREQKKKTLKSMTRWNEGILRFANAVRLSDLFCIIL